LAPGKARDRQLIQLALTQLQLRLAGLDPGSTSSAAHVRSLRRLRRRLVWIRWTAFLDASGLRRILGLITAGDGGRKPLSHRVAHALRDADRLVHGQAP
jgi:hypothetical protein